MADDLARLGLQIDSSQAAKAAGDLDSLASSSAGAQKATDSLRFSSQEFSAALAANGGNIEKATAALAQNATATGAVAAAQKAAAAQAAATVAANVSMAESLGALGSSAVRAAAEQVAAYEATATAAAASAAVQNAANDAVHANSTVVRESLVLLREASVGNFTRMAGSASILLSALGLLNAILIPLGVAAAAFGSAFLLATNQINSGVKGTGDLAAGLGLTADQLDRVKDRYVTLGDTIKATFQVIWEGLVGPNFATKVQSVWNAIVDFIYESMVISTGAVQGAVNDMVEAWKALPKALGGEGTTAGIDFSKAFKKGMDDTRAQMDKFYGDIAARARKNAKERILDEAGKAGAGPTVDEVARATGQLKQLQDETAAQQAYNDAVMSGSMTVAEYARQESIDNGVKSLQIKYNADVAAGTAKSAAEAAKLLPILSALKTAYGAAYDQKAISQQIAANDNLIQQNQLLEKQIDLAGKSADQRALEIAQYKEIIDLQRRGIDPNSSAGQTALGATADQVRRQQGVQRSSLLNLVPDSGTRLGTQAATNVLTNPNSAENQVRQQQEAYSEIDKLRQQDVLNEQQAAQAKAQVDDQINQQRLSQMGQFYGALAGLSGSSNKTLAAIGKTSAIAQATISAYSAINKAWDSAPFPANLPAVAIVTAQTFANIAAIEGFANGVVGISGPGTGTSDSIPAWLSAGESVITAQATRNNRNTLAAMNAGANFDAHRAGGGDVITVSPVFQIDARGAQQGVGAEIKRQLAEVAPTIISAAVASAKKQSPNWVASANKNPRNRAS